MKCGRSAPLWIYDRPTPRPVIRDWQPSREDTEPERPPTKTRASDRVVGTCTTETRADSGGQIARALQEAVERRGTRADADTCQKPADAYLEPLYHLVLIRDFKYLYRPRGDLTTRFSALAIFSQADQGASEREIPWRVTYAGCIFLTKSRWAMLLPTDLIFETSTAEFLETLRWSVNIYKSCFE